VYRDHSRWEREEEKKRRMNQVQSVSRIGKKVHRHVKIDDPKVQKPSPPRKGAT